MAKCQCGCNCGKKATKKVTTKKGTVYFVCDEHIGNIPDVVKVEEYNG